MRGATILIAVLLATPVHAEIMITNTARITGGASAVVSTGGNEVDPGGVIETGEARASASSKTVISGEGGTVETRIETSANGKRTVEERRTAVPAGEDVHIITATSSMTGGQIIREAAEKEVATASPVVNEDASDRDLEKPTTASLVSRFLDIVRGMFSQISLLAWWR